MDGYKNEEYLKQQIMSQNRHQFIFGYNNEVRRNFTEELGRKFPIKVDSNDPMGIYIRDFGLPKIEFDCTAFDNSKIGIVSIEYLTFTIVYNLLLKAREDIGDDLLNLRIQKVFAMLNNYSINPGCPDIVNLQDLLNIVEQSKEFYRMYYIDYLTNGFIERTPDELALPFLHLESFVSQYKKALNNDSHFNIIIEKCEDVALSSVKAVNNLVGARINKDISMKIVVEPREWDSYIAFNGQCIEAVHDYGIVELDNSHGEYVKKLKESNALKIIG